MKRAKKAKETKAKRAKKGDVERDATVKAIHEIKELDKRGGAVEDIVRIVGEHIDSAEVCKVGCNVLSKAASDNCNQHKQFVPAAS